MNEPYTFEPSRAEILQTTLLSGTLGRLFYRPFVRALTIRPEDRVLDYCAGSGILTDLIARRYRPREVVFTDVSLSWLQTAQARMKKHPQARGVPITTIGGYLDGGHYDTAILHYTLHDFPAALRPSVLAQLAENLKPGGTLWIREPLRNDHGIPLCALVNLIDSAGCFSYTYRLGQSRLAGQFGQICAVRNA